MTHLLKEDQNHLKDILDQTLRSATDFLDTLDKRPSGISLKPKKSFSLPARGLGAQSALKLFRENYESHLSGSAGPRYFGFVTGGSTPAAVSGDWLTSIYDQNATGIGDSCAPIIELETIALLRDLFGLPPSFFGSFVSGATLSNFVGLALGRQWVCKKMGLDPAKKGLYQIPPIKIFSAGPHSSLLKSLAMLGMGRDNVQRIPSLPNREAMNVNALEEELCLNPDTSCIVMSNAGTVNSVDFDSFKDIELLKKKYSFWHHVDAAFGGFSACSPKYKHLVAGWETADSITIDLHKWLNVPYDSAVQLTRHPDLQLEVFQNVAPYLGAPTMAETNFLHLTPENSRRFRALPTWMTLMAYGREGYQEIVERCVALALTFGSKLEASNHFKLVAPTRLNVVCFTFCVKGKPASFEILKKFLEHLRDGGKTFLTPTVYAGTPAIRAALVNWQTEEKDIEIAVESLQTTVQSATF